MVSEAPDFLLGRGRRDAALEYSDAPGFGAAARRGRQVTGARRASSLRAAYRTW